MKIKLLPATSFDQVTQIGMAIHGIVAKDPESGAELHTSRGREKAGRGHHYWVAIPTCNLSITARGDTYHEDIGFKLSAFTVAEAIEKANAELATPS